MIADEACFERGCICYDSRESQGVLVVRKREWQGLTDDEIDMIYQGAGKHDFAISREVEAKLKEKNNE
jgi:hypothetical protein